MPYERRGGAPVSSRTPDIEPPTASTRSVTLPGYVPPPRPQEGPKSVLRTVPLPRLPSSSGNTGQWRPLEQLVGPPTRPPPPPSVRPTALTIPPAPPSLQGFADSSGPNVTAQSRPTSAPRARSWALAVLALAIGVGIGSGVVHRGDTSKVVATSAAKPTHTPTFERTHVAPAAAPSELAIEFAEPPPVEITLDEESAPKDSLAQRRASQRALHKSVERPSDILPDFPETTPAPSSTSPPKKPKTEQQLGLEAKDLANAQLESLL